MVQINELKKSGPKSDFSGLPIGVRRDNSREVNKR